MNRIETIVHIADVHFRTYLRHIEFRSVCDYFFDKMNALKPDRIVIAGDLVQSRNQLTPELVHEVSWFLKKCSEVAGKVVMIPGNHDIVEQNKERMDALTPIVAALEKSNILYFKKSGLYPDENIIWTVYNIYDNNTMPKELIMKPYKGVYVGLYHGLISGAINDKGFTFKEGHDPNKFDDCDFTLCGDIHKRQVLYSGRNKPIIMPGSMIQQDYGETISGHGFNLIKLKYEGDDYKMDFNFHDIPNPVKYLAFQINDFEDIEQGNELLINA